MTLGDGTDESNLKMSTAVANLEPFLGELFNNDYFTEMCSQNDFLPKPTSIFDSWKNEVEAILQKGNLGSSVVFFFHSESDTDILARFVIKFLVE